MSLRLTILGSSSAIPAFNRCLSAQVLQCDTGNYLIDCGEGTQFQLIAHGIRISRINSIFISHLHGDHLFGLPGLLGTLSMQGRKKPLTIYGPSGLGHFIDVAMEISSTHIDFALDIIPVDPQRYYQVHEDEQFRVFTIPLKHRVPTCGYKFVTREKRNIDPEVIHRFGLHHNQIRQLIAGTDVQLPDGTVLPSARYTFARQKEKSYVYVSDTKYNEQILPFIRESDLLFHEATYDHTLVKLAGERMHSTAAQAAQLAQKAGVKKLLIGHFSSRYRNLEPLRKEAESIFPETYLATEGASFEW